nr:immunoglobulin light chain junction region [Macaca mulatta]
CLQSSNWPHTF